MANPEKIFVDTSILVHAHDLDAGVKRAIAEQVLRQLWDDRLGVLSTHVLEEFYVTVTEAIATPIARREARDLLAAYSVWPVITIAPVDILAASDFQERFRLPFRDALIATAALKSGATMILSPALHPYRQIAGIEVRNPFE